MAKKATKEKVAMNGKKQVSQKAQLAQIRKKNIMVLVAGIVVLAIMLCASITHSHRHRQCKVVQILYYDRYGVFQTRQQGNCKR